MKAALFAKASQSAPLASARSNIVLATISINRSAGGIEKNIVRLANALVERGFEVKLITFDQPGAISFFPLDDRVRWEQTGDSRPHGRISFFSRLRLIRRCRRAIAQHGRNVAVLCFHHGILIRFLLATRLLRARVFCTERNSLAHYNYIKARKWNANFLALFAVERIIVQFPNYAHDYPALLRRKIVAIPNPVLPAPMLARPHVPSKAGRYTLISAARFSIQKNLPALLEAFTSLAPRYPNWDLTILGHGERTEPLDRYLRAPGLVGRICLPGNVSDPDRWFANAHIFCLPSTWEGFPNALAEALAAGLPAVGYAKCPGVNELIEAGTNGLLADGNGSPQTLQTCLETLMADHALRAKMGKAAERSMRAYGPAAIFAQWEALLTQS